MANYKYYKRYCKDIENVENFEKAAADNFKGWQLHHILETHNSDGERRLVDITASELVKLGMYYNRPAEELIFLTSREHNAFNKGKPKSEETRKKLSEAHKGKQFSEEHKKKLSESKKGENNSMYGKKHSEEARKKMGNCHKGNTNTKGMHWYNNGKINKLCYECPEGYVPGRLI